MQYNNKIKLTRKDQAAQAAVSAASFHHPNSYPPWLDSIHQEEVAVADWSLEEADSSSVDEIEHYYYLVAGLPCCCCYCSFDQVEGAVQNCYWVERDASSFDLVVAAVDQIDYYLVEEAVAAVDQIVAFVEGVEILHRLVVEAFHHVAAVVACLVVVEILFRLLLGVVALDSRSLFVISLSVAIKSSIPTTMQCSWRF